jgi:hypothetical protein
MKTVYALPCVCGKTIEVDRSQAGLRVHCECGRIQDVPTIRGLAALESRIEAEPAAKRTWGAGQAVVFLGLAIALIAGMTALYCQLFPPTNPVELASPDRFAQVFDKLTPAASYELWNVLSQGLDRTEHPLVVRFRDHLERHQRWTKVAWGVSAAGLLTAIVGAAFVAARPRAAPRRAAVGARSS